jgi:hypothetical protein
VITGGSAYNYDGTLKWKSSIGGNFGAIGNFDADSFPEIAVKTGNSVALLEHTGAVKWGPIAVPGGGGGPITVADFDGDGEPEIGTAGASNYVVFETNGSIKWQSPTRDFSSRLTGSSVFDFEGDGKAEVLYGDELNFRIFDGATGKVLFKTPNPSGTLVEYPLIADIDNDGHAEIIVVSNNYAFPGTTGIRAFENRNDNWMPTRAIWNQHSYHINNVNDDGAIPQYESASWLSHNTYRLNTFADRNALDQADITASRLLLIDNGFGQKPSLKVRIGNAGLAALDRSVTVAFYQGAPGAGGVLLGSLNLAELANGDYNDIILDNVELNGSNDLYAVADSDLHVAECDETNNQVSIPITDAHALGTIQAATDAVEYGPNSPVQLNAVIENTGALQANFSAVLKIEDSEGNPVAEFAPIVISDLAGGASTAIQPVWNTGLILSGGYKLHGLLFDAAGNLAHEQSIAFTIVNGVLPALEARVSTDKPVYAAFDQVQLAGRLANTSQNTILPPTTVEIAVYGPDGTAVYSNSMNLGELVPSALRDQSFTYSLRDAASGDYPVELRVKDTASQQLIAVRRTVFAVERQLVQALTGTVAASPLQMNQGDPAHCTETVTYLSSMAANNVNLTSQLINMDNGQLIKEATRTVGMSSGQTLTQVNSISTDKLDVGAYACILTGQIDGISRRLAFAGFDVLTPPIRIDSQLRAGNRGRVLALIDDAPDQCVGISKLNLESTGLTAPLPASAKVVVNVFDTQGNLLDSETADLDARNINKNGLKQNIDLSIEDFSGDHLSLLVDAPNGLTTDVKVTAQITAAGVSLTLASRPVAALCPASATVGGVYGDFRLASIQRLSSTDDPSTLIHTPSLSIQRQTLESLLTRDGWSYTIAADKAAFTRELHTGAYAAYLLLSSQIKLDEPVQKELREAVYRGDGLIEAGGHDQRQGRVDEFLGIKFLGKHPGMSGITIADTDAHAPGSAALLLTDKTLKAQSLGAGLLGTFSNTAEPAMTSSQYGAGKADYFGFDLLAEASMPAADPLFADLLLGALDHVHPATLKPLAGTVYPLQLLLVNRGVGTPGQALLPLPDGVSVFDQGSAILMDNSLIWPFDLIPEQTQTFDTWISLPAAPVHLTASIQTGVSPSFKDHATAMLDIAPLPAPTLEDILLDVQALDAGTYKHVIKYLEWALQDQQSGRYANALAALIRASDALIAIGPGADAELRTQIAEAMRVMGQKL